MAVHVHGAFFGKVFNLKECSIECERHAPRCLWCKYSSHQSHQYQLRAISPNLILTKVTRYIWYNTYKATYTTTQFCILKVQLCTMPLYHKGW